MQNGKMLFSVTWDVSVRLPTIVVLRQLLILLAGQIVVQRLKEGMDTRKQIGASIRPSHPKSQGL
jgi:uncharacterized membrane protein YdfJ with MMPL/SSD domain